MRATREQCEQFLAALKDLLECADDGALETIEEMVASIHTFAESGILTRNLGLTITLPDGGEIMLQINGSWG